MRTPEQFVAEVVIPKLMKRKGEWTGWTRFHSESDILPGGYFLLTDEKFRARLLSYLSDEHRLQFYKEVKFLPPCDLDPSWCLDVTPTAEFYTAVEMENKKC